MRYLGGLFAMAALVLLLFGTLLQCLFGATYDMDFYARQYEELGRPEAIGISEDDLLRVTGVLTAYLRGAREDITVSAAVRGEERVIFNEKEVAHMVDVRKLYDLARTLRNACFVAGGLLLLLGLWLGKRRRSTVFAGAFWGCIAFFVLAGIFAYFAVTDFSGTFTGFHEALFTNDLWLLDPRTDILIQMFPTQFFQRIALLIGRNFAIAALIILVVCLIGRRVSKRRAAHV